MARSKQARFSSKLAAALDELSALGLKLGGVMLVIIAGYIIYALQSGTLDKMAEMSVHQRWQAVELIRSACRALGAAGLVVTLCVFVRYYREEFLGYALSLAGALLYFGLPYMLASHGGDLVAEAKKAAGVIIQTLRTTGLVLFVPGSALIARDVALRLFRSLTERKISRGAIVWGREERANLGLTRKLYGSCWDMPYCREYVRSVCRAYVKRKPCWRLKAGCYCDEGVIQRAIKARGVGDEFVKAARFTHDSAGHRGLSAAEKRARCRRCAIYAEHQQQKYKIASTLVVPAVVVAIWRLMPDIQIWLQRAVAFADRFMKIATIQPPQSAGGGDWAGGTSGFGTVEWMFIAWLGIMLVSYALQLVEYLIFKVQV